MVARQKPEAPQRDRKQIAIDSALWRKLKKLADANGRPITYELRELVEAETKRRRKR